MSARRFEAIFWDNDGLLVDTEPLYFQSTREVFEDIGLEYSYEWYVNQHLSKGVSSFDFAVQQGVLHEKIAELREKRDLRFEELLKEGVTIVDGVHDVLKVLHKNCVMGVVTGSSRKNLDVMHEKTGLLEFFNFIITADDVKKVKPDLEAYIRAVQYSGKPKAHCLVLEDSVRGVKAAKDAGLTCFAVPDQTTKTHDFSIADKVLKNIRELPALVLPSEDEAH